jgi:hypothetical protein
MKKLYNMLTKNSKNYLRNKDELSWIITKFKRSAEWDLEAIKQNIQAIKFIDVEIFNSFKIK